MRILITGAKGFIGRNLCWTLKNIQEGKDRSRPQLQIDEVYEFDVESDTSELELFCQKADFVFHLAGVNRPKESSEYMEGNCGSSFTLLNTLRRHNNICPVMFSSSIQASLDNPYGTSKRAGENLFFDYAKETGAKVLVYRFPNVFGKWCRPNYNSVVATFCHNIANDIPIKVNDPTTKLHLVYIDDVIEELLDALEGKEHHDGNYCIVPIVHDIRLGELAEMIYFFAEQPRTLMIPDMPKNSLAKKIYSTYLSYLPKEKIAYSLKMNIDGRGSFTELIHTLNNGQVSVNISKPGITKGQHWHQSKWELFIVVAGKGLIQQRKIGTDEVLEFRVNGDQLQCIHMLPGYTHNIINLSETENLVTVMYCNENFNPKKPDTYYEEV